MYINQQDAQIFHYMLYMFRTILVHPQEQLFISCISHLVYSGTCGCCVAIATQQPDIWYRHIPAYTKCGYSHTTARIIGIYRHIPNKVALDDGLTKPETCRAPYENKN